jgi:hypothetical protein
MVKLGSSSKTSSGPGEVTGRFVVELYKLLAPQDTNIENGHIIGRYRFREINKEAWKDAPHIALANIPTYDGQGQPNLKPAPGARIDPKSVERFVRVYGGFIGAYGDDLEDAYDEDGGIFDQDIAEVAKHQDGLRQAWLLPPETGTGEATLGIQSKIGWEIGSEHTFKVNMFPGLRYDEIDLTTNDLWGFIGYLFLRDFTAGKIGFCGNPDCPAPYYLKSRSDQQYCLSGKGTCTAYAQRQYALKWWHENRQGKRAKKRGRPSHRSKRRRGSTNGSR